MKNVRAKTALLWVAGFGGLFTIIFGLVAGRLLINELQHTAAQRQSAILSMSIRSSLHYDLLNSNILLASDRLKSMLTPAQWSAVCVEIQAIQLDLPEIRLGNPESCNKSQLFVSREEIYFSQDRSMPAFSIQVKTDPERLPFSTSTKTVSLITLFLLMPLLTFVLISGFASSILDTIFKILKSEHSSLPQKIGFYEYASIAKLIAIRDQSAIEIERAHSKAREADALAALSLQVSHDIRSPLSALNAVLHSITELSEPKRLLLQSVSKRINDIANNLLLEKNSPRHLRQDIVLVAPLIECLINEKRLEVGSKQISIVIEAIESPDLKIQMDEVEFSRIISNLLNNSIDALPDHMGSVCIRLSQTTDYVHIDIEDNGVGFPPEVLARLGERGLSHGKTGLESGSGLGLYHAITTLKSFGGDLQIRTPWKGRTVVALRLPRHQEPKNCARMARVVADELTDVAACRPRC